MLAEKRYEAREAVYRPVRRKNPGLLHAVKRSQMARVLIIAAGALLLVIPYVSAYANATQIGYDRAALTARLSRLKTENQMLRLQQDSLRQPQNIEAFAVASGMEQSRQMAFIKTDEQPNVAQNTDTGAAR
jgi:cell division protein FtsL